jgi:hypothetical protein
MRDLTHSHFTQSSEDVFLEKIVHRLLCFFRGIGVRPTILREAFLDLTAAFVFWDVEFARSVRLIWERNYFLGVFTCFGFLFSRPRLSLLMSAVCHDSLIYALRFQVRP